MENINSHLCQVHRRLLIDDYFGVGEALNETEHGQGLVARGKHYLIFGSKSTTNPTLQGQERLLQNHVLMLNWLFFDDIASKSYNDWKLYQTSVNCMFYDHFSSSLILFINPQHTAIGEELPSQIYLMTFEPWNRDSYLIRLEHILEKNEDATLSAPVTVNLTKIFPGEFEFIETALAANQRIEDMSRLKFIEPGTARVAEPSDAIIMKPMEIRTFIMLSKSSEFQNTETTPTTTQPSTTTGSGIRSQVVFKIFPFIVLIMMSK